MPEGSPLVSTTALQKPHHLLQPAFIEVSGYNREELLGQPHNMIRHPDMPREAFRDLWATIQAGLPWSALVKNRRKNGDHYWVVANVTPVLEKGRVSGYMSVRHAGLARAGRAGRAPVCRHARRGRRGPAGDRAAPRPVQGLSLAARLRGLLDWGLGGPLAGVGIALPLAGVALSGALPAAAAIAAALALGLAAAWWLRTSAVAPLKSVIAVANRMAAGDCSSSSRPPRPTNSARCAAG